MIHDVGKIQDLTTGIRVAGLLISAWLLASDGGSVAAAFNVGANTVAAQVLSFLFSQSGAIAVNVGGQAAINYLKFELNDQDYHEALAVVSLELNRVIDEEMHLIRVYPSGSIDGKLHQQSALNRMRLMKMAVESVIVESLKNVIDLKSFTERTFKSTLKNTGVAFIKGLLIGSGVDPQAVAWSEEGIRLAIDQYKQFSEKAQHDEYGAQVKKINQDLAQALIRRRGKERKSIGLHPDEEEINQELGYMFPRVLLCSLTKRRILDLGLDLQSDENKDLTSVLSQEIHPSLWGVAQQSIGEFKLPSWLDKSWDFTKNQLFEIMLSGLAESELREGLEGSESFKENFLQWSTTNYIDDPFIIDPGQFVLAE